MGELDKAQSLTTAASTGNKSYLFYGPPGTYKTTLAVKHPGKNKIYLDIDNKLHEMEFLTAEERAAITVWTPNESLIPGQVMVSNVDRERKNVTIGAKIQKKPLGYQKTVDIINELLKMAYEGKFPYDCAVLDSVTHLENHLEYLVLFQHDVTQLNQTLYGVVRRNNIDLLTGFLRLPCDRIVITHDRHRTKRDKQGDIIEETIRPNVLGALTEEMMSYFSEGYYFLGSNDQGKTWRVQTGGDALKPARTTKTHLKYEQVIDPSIIYKR